MSTAPSDERPSEGYKQCPDCAEMVRTEAKVCRYCGYRFDGARPRGGGGLMGLLSRRNERASTLEEVLEEWGVELEPGESEAFFTAASIAGIPGSPLRGFGFLLVTDQRLLFFIHSANIPLRSGRRASLAYERRLGQLGKATLKRSIGSSTILLGPEGPEISGLSPRERAQAILEHLDGHRI